MNINEEICRVLALAGENGLSVKKISLHVCNACNDLFSTTSYDDVHNYVLKFLRRNASRKQSYIKKGKKKGYYYLQPSSYDLFPNWDECLISAEQQDKTAPKESITDSPCLFHEADMKG